MSHYGEEERVRVGSCVRVRITIQHAPCIVHKYTVLDSPAGTQWKPTEMGTVLVAEQPSAQCKTGSMEKHFETFLSNATGFSTLTNLRCSLQAIKKKNELF